MLNDANCLFFVVALFVCITGDSFVVFACVGCRWRKSMWCIMWPYNCSSTSSNIAVLGASSWPLCGCRCPLSVMCLSVIVTTRPGVESPPTSSSAPSAAARLFSRSLFFFIFMIYFSIFNPPQSTPTRLTLCLHLFRCSQQQWPSSRLVRPRCQVSFFILPAVQSILQLSSLRSRGGKSAAER